MEVTEWFYPYNDTGIVPAGAQLGMATIGLVIVFASKMHETPAMDAHIKGIFGTVVGAPLLLTVMHCVYVTVFPQEDTPEEETFVMQVMSYVEWIDEWVFIKFPTFIAGKKGSFSVQCVLFLLGVYWCKEKQVFDGKGRRDLDKTKLSQTAFVWITIIAFFSMPMITYVVYIAYVCLKFISFRQIYLIWQEFRIFWNSPECTSTPSDGKSTGNKNKSTDVKTQVKVCRYSDPFTLCNNLKAMLQDKNLKDDELEAMDLKAGFNNNTERLQALMPFLRKYYDEVTDDRDKPTKRKT